MAYIMYKEVENYQPEDHEPPETQANNEELGVGGADSTIETQNSVNSTRFNRRRFLQAGALAAATSILSPQVAKGYDELDNPTSAPVIDQPDSEREPSSEEYINGLNKSLELLGYPYRLLPKFDLNVSENASYGVLSGAIDMWGGNIEVENFMGKGIVPSLLDFQRTTKVVVDKFIVEPDKDESLKPFPAYYLPSENSTIGSHFKRSEQDGVYILEKQEMPEGFSIREPHTQVASIASINEQNKKDIDDLSNLDISEVTPVEPSRQQGIVSIAGSGQEVEVAEYFNYPEAINELLKGETVSYNQFGNELVKYARFFDPNKVNLVMGDGATADIDVPYFGDLRNEYLGFKYESEFAHTSVMLSAAKAILGNNFGGIQLPPVYIQKYINSLLETPKDELKYSVLCFPFGANPQHAVDALRFHFDGKDLDEARLFTVVSTPNMGGEIKLNSDLPQNTIITAPARKNDKGELFIPDNYTNIVEEDGFFGFPDQITSLWMKFSAFYNSETDETSVKPSFYKAIAQGASLSADYGAIMVGAIASRLEEDLGEIDGEMLMNKLKELCPMRDLKGRKVRVADLDLMEEFFFGSQRDESESADSSKEKENNLYLFIPKNSS